MLILGYDPGGVGNNGLAILDLRQEQPVAQTFTSDCVDDAFDWFAGHVDGVPDAVGIDTFLSWATGPSGWRPMDTILRDNHPAILHSVLSSNSAYGAMAIQGVSLAMRLQQHWPEIALNEAHPKVLYFALTNQQYAFDQPMVTWLLNQFIPALDVEIANDHEWDALISAWATWMGLTGQWNVNLMDGVPDLLLPAGPATYFWP